MKWSFSLSKTRMLYGGWIREQVIQDLPSSHDIAGAQVHLIKGGIRQMHWHRVVCLPFPSLILLFCKLHQTTIYTETFYLLG